MNVAVVAPVSVVVVEAAVADVGNKKSPREGCFLDCDTKGFPVRVGDEGRMAAHQSDQARERDDGEGAKRDENGRFCDGDVWVHEHGPF